MEEKTEQKATQKKKTKKQRMDQVRMQGTVNLYRSVAMIIIRNIVKWPRTINIILFADTNVKPAPTRRKRT